jgi:hypothetical protein
MTAKVYDLRKYRKRKAAAQKIASQTAPCGNTTCKRVVRLAYEHISQLGSDTVWCSRACWMASVEATS